MAIVFETQFDFNEAVMEVIKERLGIFVSVSMETSDDYYSNEQVPKVEIDLQDKDEDGVGLIARGSGKAY